MPGMQILDVGANFGYYTTIFARLVGPTGKVWAFEPTVYYRERIYTHLELNGLSDRVTVLDYGLSDRNDQMVISIGNSSATLHPVSSEESIETELIRLRRLDDVYTSLGMKTCDLIKVDIDGHEPYFIAGAEQFLRKYRPIIVIEFNQSNLEAAGSDARSPRKQLNDLDYVLYSERTGRAFSSCREFLMECGSLSHSANVWAYPSERV